MKACFMTGFIGLPTAIISADSAIDNGVDINPRSETINRADHQSHSHLQFGTHPAQQAEPVERSIQRKASRHRQHRIDALY
jgi:UDP-N-acetyl-D-mannosaminuronate dehydrogenase